MLLDDYYQRRAMPIYHAENEAITAGGANDSARNCVAMTIGISSWQRKRPNIEAIATFTETEARSIRRKRRASHQLECHNNLG